MQTHSTSFLHTGNVLDHLVDIVWPAKGDVTVRIVGGVSRPTEGQP